MAAKRFFTTEQSVAELLKQPPRLHFSGRTRTQWQAWRRTFRAELLRLLGPRPPQVPLKIEVLRREKLDGCTREKIAFNPDPFSTIVAYVLVPEGIKRGERRSAVLCAHGHGDGKDPLAGILPKDFTGFEYSKSFALKLAQRGFVTIAPDWRSFGERRDRKEYLTAWGNEHGTDGCDLSLMTLGYFGYHLLNLDLCDAMRCIDYLQARPDVDASNIGCMGCSFGGTMTTFAAALDPRIKAAVISCYLSTIADAINDRGKGNTCGSQFLFGLRAIGDISDVAGLIAPRPCLVQIGKDDKCFVKDDALGAFSHLKKIYSAAQAKGSIELDLFEGQHEINLPTSVKFFEKTLGSK